MIIGSFELDASNLKKHTLLIFRTDLLHEVTEILEGTRYVMKISLFKEESLEAMNEIAKEITPAKSTEPNIHQFLQKKDEDRYYEIRNSNKLWAEYEKRFKPSPWHRRMKYGMMD